MLLVFVQSLVYLGPHLAGYILGSYGQRFVVEASSKHNEQQTSELILTTTNTTIRMPDIRPDYPEQYLCIAHRIQSDLNLDQYIVGFSPSSKDSKRVHHMLIYGCQMPGVFQRDSPNFVWDCGSMHAGGHHDTTNHDMNDMNNYKDNKQPRSSFEMGPVCDPLYSSQVLYGWAMEAPALKLPAGVGFKIGGSNTGINFLVLQVHYGHSRKFESQPELTDNTGLVLDLVRQSPPVVSGTTGAKTIVQTNGEAQLRQSLANADSSSSEEKPQRITKRAGVLLLSSVGYVLPGRSKHEIWCRLDEDDDDNNENNNLMYDDQNELTPTEPPFEIHPFRYRVHTHTMGVKVMGAKIGAPKARSPDGFRVDQAQVIGTGDPQKAQMFYPVSERNQRQLTLRPGDSVYASCEFVNNKSHAVRIGQTAGDEMCNFYLMYWTSSSRLLSRADCVGENPRRQQEHNSVVAADDDDMNSLVGTLF